MDDVTGELCSFLQTNLLATLATEILAQCRLSWFGRHRTSLISSVVYELGLIPDERRNVQPSITKECSTLNEGRIVQLSMNERTSSPQ